MSETDLAAAIAELVESDSTTIRVETTDPGATEALLRDLVATSLWPGAIVSISRADEEGFIEIDLTVNESEYQTDSNDHGVGDPR